MKQTLLVIGPNAEAYAAPVRKTGRLFDPHLPLPESDYPEGIVRSAYYGYPEPERNVEVLKHGRCVEINFEAGGMPRPGLLALSGLFPDLYFHLTLYDAEAGVVLTYLFASGGLTNAGAIELHE